LTLNSVGTILYNSLTTKQPFLKQIDVAWFLYNKAF